MAHRSDTESVDAAEHVFDQVNITLASIKVHFAAFLPAVRPRTVRHGEISSIRRAIPSFTVGFRVVVPVVSSLLRSEADPICGALQGAVCGARRPVCLGVARVRNAFAIPPLRTNCNALTQVRWHENGSVSVK